MDEPFRTKPGVVGIEIRPRMATGANRVSAHRLTDLERGYAPGPRVVVFGAPSGMG